MPTYAVLGATGSTGSNIVKQLLQLQETTVHIFVRSKSKLKTMIPGIADNEKVTIFEGSMSDVSLIESCISNTSATFACLATNYNEPGARIAQDTAQVIVAALIQARTKDPDVQIPTLIVLSSCSVNHTLIRDTPPLVHAITNTAFWFIYRDLEYAEAYLRLHKSWLKATFIQPGGLVEGAQKGHTLSLEKHGSLLSYADLAAGMIEVAQSGKYNWEGLAVVPTAKDVKFEPRIALKILQGIFITWMPWSFSVLKKLGLLCT